MKQFIVDYALPLSSDTTLYPLLDGLNPYDVDGQVYPRAINFSDGETYPLFVGGVVSTDCIELIASGTAETIAQRGKGQKTLVVQILEGARPFCKRVCACLAQVPASGFAYELASVRVSSYTNGSQALQHQVVFPLQGGNGEQIFDLSGYDKVVILDDLIDAGNTYAWLVYEYLPPMNPNGIEGYFMLEKSRPRGKEVEKILFQTGSVCGIVVPDEWMVGFGLDIALPGTDEAPPLHLFRNELPGGIYAFNSAIEQKLIKEYQAEPDRVREQLGLYVQNV